MPPKKRNVQFKLIQNVKKQKQKQQAKEFILDLSDKENESLQLTNSKPEDINWHDDEFEDSLNKLSSTAFEIILIVAEKPNAFQIT